MGGSKHNIGPWYESADRIRDEASDAIVATIEDGGHVEREIFSSADRKKHARLISAAPDMLEALRVAKKHQRLAINALGRSYRSGRGTFTAAKHRDDYERHTEIVERAIDAALAKSEGR